MLKCENVRSQMSAYLDREMPLWEIQLTRWHLRRCATCAHEIMQLQQTDKILYQLQPAKTADDFLSSVMRQVSVADAVEKSRTSLLHRALRKSKSSLALGLYSIRTHTYSYVAAAILAIMVAWGGVAVFHQPEPIPLASKEAPVMTQSRANELTIISIEVIPTTPPKRRLRIGE